MRILVTGCTGYIGGNLCDALSRKGHVLYGIDRDNSKMLLGLKDFRWIDLGVSNAFEKIAWDVSLDLIIHLAAQTDVEISISKSYNDAHDNIMSTINVVDLASKSRCPIIYTSSAAVYGVDGEVDETVVPSPTSPYGLSKLVGERYIEMYHHIHDLQYLIYRFSNVYGLNNQKGVIYNFISRRLSGQTMQIRGDGSQIRDFIYIDDIVDAIVYAVENRCYNKNDTYNVSTGIGTVINDLASDIINLTSEIEIDHAIEYVEADNGILTSILKNDKIVSDLGWTPKTTIQQGLSDTISYIRNRQLE